LGQRRGQCIIDLVTDFFHAQGVLWVLWVLMGRLIWGSHGWFFACWLMVATTVQNWGLGVNSMWRDEKEWSVEWNIDKKNMDLVHSKQAGKSCKCCFTPMLTCWEMRVREKQVCNSDQTQIIWGVLLPTGLSHDAAVWIQDVGQVWSKYPLWYLFTIVYIWIYTECG
jgi:hypothetical protein